jgi:membrane-bound lytic murein transglycosylase D
LANQLDLPLDVISYLNPIYKKNYIPEGSYTLRLPNNKIAQFLRNEEAIYAASMPAPKPVMPSFDLRSKDDLLADASESGSGSGMKYEIISKQVKKTHTVKKGENLALIADKYDCTQSEIKKWNHLKSTKLKSGQKLTVQVVVKKKVAVSDNTVALKKETPSSTISSKKNSNDQNQLANNNVVKDSAINSTDSTLDQTDSGKVSSNSETADNSSNSSIKSPKFIYHLVQPGDTLWNIAKKYDGVTVEMIKDINNLHDANIKPGTRLKVKING